MYAIEVKDVGVKFLLHHQRKTTLLETAINLCTGRSKKWVYIPGGNEEFWALRNITFSIKKGEALGVIGRNGAGKSTLLQILTGIYKPEEGIVRSHGKIGLLQLGTGFHPDLTARENIYLNGAILGLKRNEVDGLYDSIVDFSELERFIDTPIKNYSSGMVSRLGFSIAINIKPDILLIDEVLSVGDEGFRKKSRLKLEEIRGTGTTIVLISHSLDEIKKICERAICLDHGQLVFEGKSDETIAFYLDKFSKA